MVENFDNLVNDKDLPAGLSPDEKAVEIVKRDMKKARDYLDEWHRQCVERHKHYIAPGLEVNILKNDNFPVPFTTEQVDQFVADCMEKLWYKNEPCAIFGRNDTDKEDADVKREFMKYQDVEDEIEAKTEYGLTHSALYGIAPAVINFREDTTVENITENVPVLMDDGLPLLSLDGITPITEEVTTPTKVYTYQGASVEIIDPIDLFFTAEKREVYDEHPFMIRSFRTMEWFKSKGYIRKEGIAKLTEQDFGVKEESFKLLKERRDNFGYSMDESINHDKEFEYVERLGYADLGDGWQLYIIGTINDKVLMRLDNEKEAFNLGFPNIVVGTIASEYGEIKGYSLLDKFHSLQHAMDSLIGMWLKALRQTVNPMYVAVKNAIVNKNIVNDAGEIIWSKTSVNDAIKRFEQQQISDDIYKGIQMIRLMAQNASGLNDTSSGIAQAGVETLGEASILEQRSGVRMKGGYLRTFERTFIKPLWIIRNKINMNFVDDPGYLYSVIEDGIQYWKKITPGQVRANVDFVCEASNRENQKAVVTQQVLQALNLTIKMAEIIGPMPIIKLLEKLYEDGFGWNRDTIKQMLPMELIMQSMMEKKMMEQQEMAAKQGKGQYGVAPQEMPQPTTESGAIQSANQQFSTPTGIVQ
jgi:hypothetical protein